ncbi:hypothetical protein Nepgr_010824 [Nepenthes gracilis]|uniref:Cytochrome P450 n=1 Tax=Nepenthes gracilis TaxID=150966 RepID=A0AAD3XLP6_NEPGR|nr:hypothetical protein Nepgr_010824 [Nepenthes gracilis]
MGFVQIVAVAMVALVFFILLWSLLSACVLAPIKAHQKLRKSGFSGPKPSFPLGNLGEMKKGREICPSAGCSQVNVSHDIHSSSLPYFANWQKLHGKVFIYWMGTEPFLYVADPEFLKQMSGGVLGKQWGKPAVFKSDRVPMFGRFGLNMIEGNDWTRHRHIITPAFSSSNLRAMTNSIAESTKKKIEQWTAVITANSSGAAELDVEKEITILAGEIIAKTNFGIDNEAGKILLDKLRAMHISLFKHTRYVGVPLGQFLTLNQTLEARRLGREIDGLLLSIIDARKKVVSLEPQHDLLGMLLEAQREDRGLVKGLTTRELVDECKTFFFAGHETVALAIAWTLLLLAMHPMWQEELRREIAEVIGHKLEMDFTMLARLKKMGWVMSEVLRLYPSSPNAQRQARGDIRVGDKVIPNATNIWIDVVAMHHDQALWGANVNEFKPERFSQDLNGNCKHKMGYVPFGFGGRMCIGRNYAIMEYKIVLSLILSKFSFSLSPSYRHSPTYSFSLRPRYGVPLVVKPL